MAFTPDVTFIVLPIFHAIEDNILQCEMVLCSSVCMLLVMNFSDINKPFFKSYTKSEPLICNVWN